MRFEQDPVARLRDLLGAELLKLRTVRLPRWLLGLTLALVLLSVTVTVLSAGRPGVPLALEDPDLLARAAASASAGTTLLLVLGVLSFTQEFRHGTATPTFLVAPRRSRVLQAKALAVALVGAGFAVLSVLVALLAGVSLIAARGVSPQWDATVLQVLGGVLLTLVLSGPLGLAVGALVRNQAAAVGGVLVWTLLLEQLVVELLPEVGRWLPGGATAAVLQLGALATTRGDLVPAWAGALLLLGYAAALGALATRLTLSRDLT